MTGRQTVEEGKINRLYPRKISILFDASNIPDTIYHLRPILYFPVVTLDRRVSGARREQLPWSYTVLQKKDFVRANLVAWLDPLRLLYTYRIRLPLHVPPNQLVTPYLLIAGNTLGDKNGM